MTTGQDKPEIMNNLPGMLAVANGVAEQNWPHTMDAKVWAEEFCKLFHPVSKDLSRQATNTSEAEELMIGWFANAIMAGYDTANQRVAESAKSPSSLALTENDEPLRELCFDYRNAATAHAENYFQRIVRWVKQQEVRSSFAPAATATTDSPTPRTDTVLRANAHGTGTMGGDYSRMSEHARQLERELAEEKARHEACRLLAQGWKEDAERAALSSAIALTDSPVAWAIYAEGSDELIDVSLLEPEEKTGIYCEPLVPKRGSFRDKSAGLPPTSTREEKLAEALQLVLDDYANSGTILQDAQDKASLALNMQKSLASSATPRAELTQNRIDAEEACIDIFRDYDEAEIKDKPTSVQICWKVGQALDIRQS